jgi:hypothetical protein
VAAKWEEMGSRAVLRPDRWVAVALAGAVRQIFTQPGRVPEILNHWRSIQTYEQAAELVEVALSEVLLELPFDRRDAGSENPAEFLAPFGELDQPGALVCWVVDTFEVSELFELAEQIVHRLAGDSRLRGEVRGSPPMRSGISEHVGVGGHRIGEPGGVDVLEHPLADGLEGHAQEGSDQWSIIRLNRHDTATLQVGSSAVQ